MSDTINTRELKNNFFFNGRLCPAENVFKAIFRQAKESITLIDPKISTQTLEWICASGADVPVLVYSDNEGTDPLTRQKMKGFFAKHPQLRLLIGTVAGKCKGCYIVIDSETSREKVYALSVSPKTAGEEGGCILRMEDTKFMAELLKELGKNAYLVLK